MPPIEVWALVCEALIDMPLIEWLVDAVVELCIAGIPLELLDLAATEWPCLVPI
jgi:hypothetical protein